MHTRAKKRVNKFRLAVIWFFLRLTPAIKIAKEWSIKVAYIGGALHPVDSFVELFIKRSTSLIQRFINWSIRDSTNYESKLLKRQATQQQQSGSEDKLNARPKRERTKINSQRDNRENVFVGRNHACWRGKAKVERTSSKGFCVLVLNREFSLSAGTPGRLIHAVAQAALSLRF